MKKPLVGAFAAALLLAGAGAAPAVAQADAAGTPGKAAPGKAATGSELGAGLDQLLGKAKKKPKAVDFAGTVALSNCSGSVVRTPDAEPGDPALVMSNGHCLDGGMPGPGEVLVDQPSSRTFDLLDASGAEVGTLKASKLAYGTMTDTDVSLYELTDTYEQIESDYGIKALELNAERPTAGTAITVVSGYWKKTYSCDIDGFVHTLKEGDWTWKDSVRYTDACKTIGGTSGSPVVDDATGKVVAVNNTGNESGEECTVNNPCEVDENGKVTVRQGINYGQQTYQMVPCVGTGSKIDLDAEGCGLPKPGAGK
ncbi:serine protease [Streptomyces sp. LHD-70]|uniref:S1 family peptidase n=1 Tax=Streptomyces sp. LHD-70 TaxID=3072140 RepID=UPI0028102A9A|nr:serine protease [Streptomyces sp. LHD-70]MDQ8701635.1 serine protease [Streptomyces sp. LHD-70]